MTVPVHRAIQTPDYDDTATPEILNPSWMATIPDVYSLSDVTMPGTHNTMALYGGTLAECNSWSLALQLRAGIRFLDIRVRHVNGNLTIHHGISYQYADFGDVLMDVVDFLMEYPSETVLMRLKEELSETQNIYDSVVRYINEHAHWDLLWNSREMPTMGEARGKLIILQDFTGPDLGMKYNSLDIADDWKVRKHRGVCEYGKDFLAVMSFTPLKFIKRLQKCILNTSGIKLLTVAEAFFAHLRSFLGLSND